VWSLFCGLFFHIKKTSKQHRIGINKLSKNKYKQHGPGHLKDPDALKNMVGSLENGEFP